MNNVTKLRSTAVLPVMTAVPSAKDITFSSKLFSFISDPIYKATLENLLASVSQDNNWNSYSEEVKLRLVASELALNNPGNSSQVVSSLMFELNEALFTIKAANT